MLETFPELIKEFANIDPNALAIMLYKKGGHIDKILKTILFSY